MARYYLRTGAGKCTVLFIAALKLKGQKQPQKQLKFLPYGFLKNLFWLES